MMEMTNSVDCAVKIQPLNGEDRELSPSELLHLFDETETLRMVYVPHFLTQCVMYYLDLMMQAGAKFKLPYKKEARLLKDLQNEYIISLKAEMPFHVYQHFLAQREDYLNHCGAKLHIVYYTFANELVKRYPVLRGKEYYCYAHIVLAIIDFVERYDYSVNRKIEAKVGRPCRADKDARLTLVKAVCQRVVTDYPLEYGDLVTMAINTIKNKAIEMINEM